MPVEIVALTPELLPAAAALLARRHQQDRAMQPLLPAYYETPTAARAAIDAALQRPYAQGFAAVEDGRLLAYLIGDMVLDAVWGRSGWVRLPGCAVAAEQSMELLRDLYAVLGAHWLQYGCHAHFALAPVSNQALVQAWFSLSFGIEQVHGLLALATVDPRPPVTPPGVEIRHAEAADRELLGTMSDVIWRHQVQAPVWGIMLPEAVGEVRDGWAMLADDSQWVVWLAFYQGEAVGTQGYYPAEPAAEMMHFAAGTTHLSIAGTRSAVRGLGIGQALTRHGLWGARAQGYSICETDWRSTNLLASRFWPRQGFQPAVYRLVRRIDMRILWARGQSSAD
jgi:GNAT superfamily N-acetyltransferase